MKNKYYSKRGKYQSIMSLDNDVPIRMIEIEFEKKNDEWIEVRRESEVIDVEIMKRYKDSIPFFESLGGNEMWTDYDTFIELISVSPNEDTMIRRKFYDKI